MITVRTRLVKIALFLSLLGLTLSFLPVTSVVVPEWRITVLSADQLPIAQHRVTQVWRHSSLESASSFTEDARFSNESGVVIFPERKISASLLKRGWAIVKEKLDFLPHTSHGPYSYVFAERGVDGLTYEGGSVLPGHIVVVKE